MLSFALAVKSLSRSFSFSPVRSLALLQRLYLDALFYYLPYAFDLIDFAFGCVAVFIMLLILFQILEIGLWLGVFWTLVKSLTLENFLVLVFSLK